MKIKSELKIISDGTPSGTHFFTKKGEEIKMIKAFQISGSPEKIEASIEIMPPIIRGTVNAEFEYELIIFPHHSVEQLEYFKRKIETAIKEKENRKFKENNIGKDINIVTKPDGEIDQTLYTTRVTHYNDETDVMYETEHYFTTKEQFEKATETCSKNKNETQNKVCEWDYIGEGLEKTSCGETFESGGTIGNLKFCPYCSKKIKEK